MSAFRPAIESPRTLPLAAVLLATLLAAPAALAGDAGEVTHVSGALLAKKNDGSSRILAPRSRVEEGDLLVTSGDTYARVKFIDGAEVTLRPNSQLKVEQYAFIENRPESDNAFLRLVKGGLRTITGLIGKRRSNAYQMNGVVATIGIRGTQFGALLCQGDCENVTNQFGQTPADGLHVDVTEGMITVSNPSGDTLVGAGDFGFVASPATPPIIVPTGQGVSQNMPTFAPTPTGSSSGGACSIQ